MTKREIDIMHGVLTTLMFRKPNVNQSQLTTNNDTIDEILSDK